MEFMAAAAFGLEGIVKQELMDLGIQAKAEQGGARFHTDMAGAFKANLHLACADRVLLVLGEQEVTSFEELFDFVLSLPFEDVLPRDASFPVSGNCVRSQLMSVSDCQSITKKAIVERLKRRYKLDWFPETGASYPISITIHRDRARVTLDTSGEALNKRGYRTWVGEAPLRETLAAALVRLSPWQEEQLFYDMYLHGKSVLGIQRELEAHGFKSPTGKDRWCKRSIEKMLSNEKYSGDVIIFKTYSMSFPDTKRKVNEPAQRMKYQSIGNHPAIISKETFLAVQAERERRSNIEKVEEGVRRKATKYSSRKRA